MKVIIVLAALVAVALAAPAGDVETVKYDFDNIGTDSYSFDVALSDGSSHQSSGTLNNVGTDHESLSVKGSFAFVADDGQTYTVNYIADENGFQPSGAHIPVPV